MNYTRTLKARLRRWIAGDTAKPLECGDSSPSSLMGRTILKRMAGSHDDSRRSARRCLADKSAQRAKRRPVAALQSAEGAVSRVSNYVLSILVCSAAFAPQARAGEESPFTAADTKLQQALDAPLLFVKRHSYTGIHIYDTYYKWPPGGGGIYVLENPSAPRSEWRMRTVIDPTTSGSLGVGVYTHPELSWNATRLLFCFKGQPEGNTSIYEIGINGENLRRVTDPGPTCVSYKGSQHGQHDVAPAYLPDGRIVFLSTRLSGLVPCNNTGVAVMHVMNADGTDIHPI